MTIHTIYNMSSPTAAFIVRRALLLFLAVSLSSVLQPVEAGSVGKTEPTTVLYATGTSGAIALKPSSSVTLIITISCVASPAGSVTTSVTSLSWSGSSSSKSYTITPSASAAGSTITCSYSYTGSSASGTTALAATVIDVACSITQFSSVNLMLQNQPAAGIPCAPRQQIRAFYPFTNGQIKDTSTAGVNPTTNAIGFVNDKYSITNSAGSFVAGSSSVLVAGVTPSASAYAVSFWFQTTDNSANLHCIVNVATGTPTSFDRCLRLSSGKVTVSLYGGLLYTESITSSGSTTYNDGNWHHIVYQHSSSESTGQTVYIDGASKASGSKQSSDATNGNYVWFAYGYQVAFPSPSYSTVKIDNIGIYSRMLDLTADIAAMSSATTWLDQLACYTCGSLAGYSTTTPYPTFFLTPTFVTGTHSLKVNSVVLVTSLTSGTQISTAGTLVLGINYVTITSQEGDYVFVVNRVCDITGIVSTPAITVAPALACQVYNYSGTVPYTTSSLTVTVTFQTNLVHAFIVNGATVTGTLSNGVASGTGNLKPGNNLIVITAPEGNYYFAIMRTCDITALTFTPSITISPAYACGTASYTSTIGMIVTTLAATVTFATGTHTYTVNGVTATAAMTTGVVSDGGTMLVPSNILTISQTDGPTITITIARLSDVSSLTFSPDTITTSPAFAPGALGPYTITVPFSIQSISLTATFGVGTVAFILNQVTVDPSLTLNSPSLPGNLALPTSYTVGRLNNVTALSNIDGSYVFRVTVSPQDVRNFSLSCTTVFGGSGIIIPVYVVPSQTAISVTLLARYDSCKLAVTYQTASTVSINSPSEPWTGTAAATTAYNSHLTPFASGVPTQLIVASSIDGAYTLTITRNLWDVQSLDMQVGGGSNSLINVVTLNYAPTFIQSTAFYSASVKYMNTGVFIRAMCTNTISAELIRSGGYLSNLMPTGWSAPFPLIVGKNLIRIISADNGSPYPSVGFSSYNFTIQRNASSLTGFLFMIKPSTGTAVAWESYLKPSFSVDILSYTIDVPVWYTQARIAPVFTSTNSITPSFNGATSTVITTTGTYTSYKTLVTGMNALNAFIMSSTEDGVYTININRPMDIKSIVAYTDGGSIPLSVSPDLMPTYFTYTLSVPFKTQTVQLKVNYTVATTLKNQNNVFTAISPNTVTANIGTTFASPALLYLNNTYDGVFQIQIVYQPADMTNFAFNSNLGPLTLSPSFAAGTFAYQVSYYGSLSSLKLTATYSTALPAVNATANGYPFGDANSGVEVDLSTSLKQYAYMTTGVINLYLSSPYDGPYTITVTPACPQDYTVTPGTSDTPLCQFFASYCQQPTSGYTRVCLLTRPGCCGSPGCLC